MSFNMALTMLLNTDAKQGSRQDVTLQNLHLMRMQLWQIGAHSNLERMFRQKALNKQREMDPETKILKVQQYANCLSLTAPGYLYELKSLPTNPPATLFW